MAPFFSIIIPTLNEEQALPRILTSLTRQTEKNFDVIVVDCKSEDKTKEIAQQFAKKIPLFFYQVERRNVSFQRNYGASRAQGDYLMFLDADTGITVGFTKNTSKVIRHQRGLVFIPYILPDENNFDMKLVFNFVNFLIDMSQSIGKPLSSSGSMIFERNFFYKIGGFDETVVYAEDHDIIQRASQWGVRAQFMPSIRIKFSLRRMRKEGRLKLMYKYLISTAYTLLKGKIKKRIYNYEMGGQFYKNRGKENKEDVFKYSIRQINTYFKRIFTEE